MSHMKLKKIPKKKKYKAIFLIIVIYVVFAYTFYYSFKSIGNNTNRAFITFLLNGSNSAIYEQEKIPTVVNKS